MKNSAIECDSFVLDTYWRADTGSFHPGAITFRGRKKVDVVQWRDKSFTSQEGADSFVRSYFARREISEAPSEGVLVSRNHAAGSIRMREFIA